ncbi:MAG: ABC transporter permease [Caldilineaceae bacterium]
MNIFTRLTTLWSYRELIYNLVVRELKARYKNSVLGFVWSLLNPLGMMLVFTVVFGVLLPNTQIEKYPIFLLCGLLPWNYFSASVMGSVNSIVENANLVKKVFFPREVLPIASVLAQLVNFLLALIILFAALIIFRANFSPWLWLLPLVILMQTCFALGIAFLLSALNVYYRDTIIVMDVVMLAWFFLTPVFYSVELVPQTMTVLGTELDVRRLYYILNLMASIINMYRDLLYWGYRTDLDFSCARRSPVWRCWHLVTGYSFG